MENGYWIKKAIRHPGAFRRYASHHHGLLPNGHLNPAFITKTIRHPPNARVHKQAVLAKTLKGFHRGAAVSHSSGHISGFAGVGSDRQPVTGTWNEAKRFYRHVR